jgi:DNA-binding NarL/FixJ family response regulator
MIHRKTATHEIRILLADDHRWVRQGFRLLLESEPGFRLVGESEDGLDAVRQVAALEPDVLVLDLMMPGSINGLEVTRQVRQRSPDTRVVILSMHAEVPYISEALRNGASAYVLKQSNVGELVRAVREAMAGHRYLSPPISEAAIEAYERMAGDGNLDLYETLTTREREVFHLAVQGLNNPDIAERLFLSRRTVESHRANFMRKLGVRNQSQLVQYAVRRDFLPKSE